MNFKQLEYFCAAAEEKSISKAARRLHLAQPPISRQISMLEDELGTYLFLRNNKGIELTEAGSRLYQQCQHMFQDFRMMVDSVRDVGAGLRGLMKIGTVYSDIPIVLDYLKTFHRTHPQVELYVRLGTPKDLLEDLNRGELHVLFLRSAMDDSLGLHEKVLGADPLELVMNRALDPAPDLPCIPIQMLKDVPMCLLRGDDLWGYSKRLLQECQRHGFQPQIACQCYDTPMAMQMVQAGFGISYLPNSILKTHADSGLYTKPIQELCETSYPTLVWSSNIYYPSCVKQFIHTFSDGEELA